MTKQEFETTEERLVMIISLNPDTGEVLYGTYDWRLGEDWMSKFRQDFPDMMHFSVLNPAAIQDRKLLFGLK